MTDDILMDRIFKFFDTLNDGNITREEWIMGHNVFLKGTMDEQIEYCFNIYDLNADGFIRYIALNNCSKIKIGILKES